MRDFRCDTLCNECDLHVWVVDGVHGEAPVYVSLLIGHTIYEVPINAENLRDTISPRIRSVFIPVTNKYISHVALAPKREPNLHLRETFRAGPREPRPDDLAHTHHAATLFTVSVPACLSRTSYARGNMGCRVDGPRQASS